MRRHRTALRTGSVELRPRRCINPVLGSVPDRLGPRCWIRIDAGFRDARDRLASSETHQVVIEDPPGVEGPDAVTRISGIITFVAPQDMDLTTGTTVRVKLVDVGESHARAVATEIIEE